MSSSNQRLDYFGTDYHSSTAITYYSFMYFEIRRHLIFLSEIMSAEMRRNHCSNNAFFASVSLSIKMLLTLLICCFNLDLFLPGLEFTFYRENIYGCFLLYRLCDCWKNRETSVILAQQLWTLSFAPFKNLNYSPALCCERSFHTALATL